jgi:hypothetical protein
MDTGAIVNRIPMEGGEPYSIVFSADGKLAYIAVRHYPVEHEGSIFIYDVQKDQVIDHVSGIQGGFIGGVILAEVPVA